MNISLIYGRLTKDPDLKLAAGSGLAVTKFILAVNAMKKDAPANFIPCVSFGKQAELIADGYTKGKGCLVSGHLQSGNYMNKDNQKVYTLDLIVEQFDYTEPKNSSDITPVEGDTPF
jgi:single-strand DNA-binding protein